MKLFGLFPPCNNIGIKKYPKRKNGKHSSSTPLIVQIPRRYYKKKNKMEILTQKRRKSDEPNKSEQITLQYYNLFKLQYFQDWLYRNLKKYKYARFYIDVKKKFYPIKPAETLITQGVFFKDTTGNLNFKLERNEYKTKQIKFIGINLRNAVRQYKLWKYNNKWKNKKLLKTI
ncbi:hypothetical protein ACFL2K_03790 [Candidatus Margulisiibacteriota bacterium]